MYNNVSNFFLAYLLVFHLKKIVFGPILGDRHCGAEKISQRSFLQVMTYDMGKTCESALYRSSVLTDVCFEDRVRKETDAFTELSVPVIS